MNSYQTTEQASTQKPSPFAMWRDALLLSLRCLPALLLLGSLGTLMLAPFFYWEDISFVWLAGMAIAYLLILGWVMAFTAPYLLARLQKIDAPSRYAITIANQTFLTQTISYIIVFFLVLAACLGLALIVGVVGATFVDAEEMPMWFEMLFVALASIIILDAGFYPFLIAEEKCGAITAIKASFKMVRPNYGWLLLCVIPYVVMYVISFRLDPEIPLGTVDAWSMASLLVTVFAGISFHATMAIAYLQVKGYVSPIERLQQTN